LLRGCEFDAGIDLSGARTRDFVLDGARLAGLAAPLAEIDGNLSVIDATCSGQVVLTGAHITGACSGRCLTTPATTRSAAGTRTPGYSPSTRT
jgi:hypothetical protein